MITGSFFLIDFQVFHMRLPTKIVAEHDQLMSEILHSRNRNEGFSQGDIVPNLWAHENTTHERQFEFLCFTRSLSTLPERTGSPLHIFLPLAVPCSQNEVLAPSKTLALAIIQLLRSTEVQE
jgi:hypothetical protein